MRATPYLFLVVGGPGSGKDELIRAVSELGSRHAEIVPKHTTRARRDDDGPEMICAGESSEDLGLCDIRYENFGDHYGVQSSRIWAGLQRGTSQALVVSNVVALKALKNIFRDLARLIYVHSEVTPEDYTEIQASLGGGDYVRRRLAGFESAFATYTQNLTLFDHVLIHSGPYEDLYDQIFRLLRAYEQGYLR